MFDTLSTVSSDDVDDTLSHEILLHLASLQKEFLRYFPEISESDLKLVRKSFAVQVKQVHDHLQDELINFKNDSTCIDTFDTISTCEFWAKMFTSSLHVTKDCITKLSPFTSAYLCKSKFSTSMQIKNNFKLFRCGKWSLMSSFFNTSKNQENGSLCSAASLSLKCVLE